MATKESSKTPKFVVTMGMATFKASSVKEADEIEGRLKAQRGGVKSYTQRIKRFTWEQWQANDLSKPIKSI